MSEGCPYWKDASNLKSDFRDQIKGNHYCSRTSPAPKCDLEIIHCQTANCVKCKEFLDKRDAAIVAATRNDIVSAILTRITEAQFDKSTMQDFINYVDALRRPSAPEQEERQ